MSLPQPTQNYVFRAKITRVVDGDTLDADIDLGLHCHRIERLRLLRVNTPEIFGRATPEEREAGQKAKAFVLDWLAFGNFDATIQTYKDDAFGRYLAEVWRTDGKNLSDDLLESGNAIPFYRR